jgi:hypothetical protein
VQPTKNQSDQGEKQGEDALSVLCSVWNVRAQSRTDLDEACGNTRTCKNMAHLGFQGLTDDVVGDDLRVAWKTKLERDGKLSLLRPRA